jgi:AraC family transcriptional activator of pyochelin receptor
VKKKGRRHGSLQSFRFKSGMALHIADFIPTESINQRFESESPVLRFYFHMLGSGYWELYSPYRGTIQNRLTHSNLFSSILFYPEIEGKMFLPVEHRQFHLSIYITPSQLNNYLGGCMDPFPKDLIAISEGCVDKGFSHGGPMSQMMNMAVQNLLDCPYTGPMKELYMENKAIELIVHKLSQTVSMEAMKRRPFKVGPHETDRIHQARDILCRNLETPPRLSELAHAVGTNHCRLNTGFRELFGTTVFGYLRQKRLEEARRLLEVEHANVTEAALRVGYNSIPSFSKAFSEYFGIQPVMCRKNKS